MRARRFRSVACLITIVLIAGCSSTPERDPDLPSWVMKGRPVAADRDTLYAVGSAEQDPNERMMRTQAAEAARVELSRQIQTYVASLVTDFMQSHRDYADPKSGSSVQFTRAVSKSVSEAVLSESEQIDSYVDKVNGRLYMLYRMPASNIRKNAELRARALARQQSINPFTQTESALDALGEHLSKQYGVRPEEPDPTQVTETPDGEKEPADVASDSGPSPSTLPSGPAPDWIQTQSHPQYPIARYMIGVGMGKDVTRARDDAKAAIAAQIRQVVSRDVEEVVKRLKTNTRYDLSESLVVATMSNVTETLVGSRVVEQWYDRGAKQVYCLAVLDRQVAGRTLADEAVKQRKDAEAALARVPDALAAGQIVNALRDLKAALVDVSEYQNRRSKLRVVNDALLTQVPELPRRLAVTTIWDQLQQTVQRVDLRKTAGDRQESRPGIGLKQELKVQAVYPVDGRQVPVRNLALACAFETGRGTLQDMVRTDREGTATCKVSRVEQTGLEVNTIKVSVNAKGLGISDMGLSLPRPVIFQYTIPTKKTSQIAVYLIEHGLGGERSKRSIAQDQVLQALTNAGYRVLDETEAVARAQKAKLGKNATDAEIIEAMAAKNVTFIVFGHVSASIGHQSQRGGGYWTIAEARGGIRVIDVFANKVVATLTPKSKGAFNTPNKQQAEEGAAKRAVERLGQDAGKEVVKAVKKYFGAPAGE